MILEKLNEEKALGRVLGPLTPAQAARARGCKVEELVPGKPAVIQNADGSYLAAFDGTASGVNPQTRPLGQHECPGLAEGLIIQRAAQARTSEGRTAARRGLLTCYVKPAHRLTKRAREDWRYLIMRVGNDLWIICVWGIW